MAGIMEWLASPQAQGLFAGLAGTQQRGFGPAIASGVQGMQQATRADQQRQLYEGQLAQLQQQQEEAKRRAESRRKLAALVRGEPGDAFEQDRAIRVASADPTAAIPIPPKRQGFMNLPPDITEAASLSDDPLGTALKLSQMTQKDEAPIKLGPGDTLLDPRTRQPLYTAPTKPDASPEYVRLLQASGIDPASPEGQQMLRQYLERKGQGQQFIFPPGPKAGEKAAYESVEKWADTVMAGAEEGRKTAGRVKIMGSLLNRIPTTGSGTEFKMGVANAAQSIFGWKVDPNLPDKELFRQISTQLQIEAAPKGQGQVSNYERDLFARAVINMATSREGIQKALYYYQKLAEYDQKAGDILDGLRDPETGVLRPNARNEVRKRLGPAFSDAEVEEMTRIGSTDPAGAGSGSPRVIKYDAKGNRVP